MPASNMKPSNEADKDGKQFLYRLKYILYGIMGGFYFSPRYQPRTKYLWGFVNFVAILISQFLGTIGYFMLPTSKPVRDIFYAVLTSNVVILAVFATPSLTYYFKREIEQVLTLSEEEFFAHARADLTQLRLAKTSIIKMVILHLVSVGVFVFVHPLFQFFSTNDHSLNDLDYNIFPHIWLGSVQTAPQYYAIFTVHLVAAALVLISFITISIYVYFVGQELCVAFSGLKNFLHDSSTLAKRNLEMASTNQILGETSRKSRLENDKSEDYKMAYDDHRQRLFSNLIIAIRAHQVLSKKMKMIKPHIEFLFSSVLMILVGDQCFFTYMMCSTDLNNFLKTKEILGIVYINIILFTYCYAGKLLDEAATMISMQLSGIPWYYLNSHQRRVYYIFVCQTQRTMHFHAFGVYAMNMPIVLQNLKIVFSFYNILQNVLNK